MQLPKNSFKQALRDGTSQIGYDLSIVNK